VLNDLFSDNPGHSLYLRVRSAEEVGGWHQADRMGVSVGVVYDSEVNGCVTYLEQEMDHLVKHLQSFELVVGLNNKRFDNMVLSAYTSIDLIQQYCRSDIEITRDLLYYALEQGFLLFANKAKQKVRLPLAVEKTIEDILRSRY